jgi:hypothetical protein
MRYIGNSGRNDANAHSVIVAFSRTGESELPPLGMVLCCFLLATIITTGVILLIDAATAAAIAMDSVRLVRNWE